jgi:carboxyl-terminal processing protease
MTNNLSNPTCLRRLLLPAFLLMSVFFSLSLSAQVPIDDAYRRIQDARSRANGPLEYTNNRQTTLDSSLRVFDSAVHFLDTLHVSIPGFDNTTMKYRGCDLFRDYAGAYALDHKPDSAIYFLNRMYALGCSSINAKWISADSSFISMRSDPRLISLVKKMSDMGKLMTDSGFRSPYTANLSEDQKIAGLTLLWSQAKYNFVNFDHLDINWDQTYLDYLPRIRATTSTAAYYRVLQRFYATLRDGHTNVYPPDTIAKMFYSRPPIVTALIEGRVFVTEVRSDSLKQLGIVPGLEILKIDGQPVIDYAQQNVAPYVSSSTPQDLQVRSYTYSLLSGPDTSAALTCKEKDGKVWTKQIARTGYHDLKKWKTMDWRVIERGKERIGYLALNDFEHNSLRKMVDSLFPEIEKTTALVIDVRQNGGGSGNIGFYILTMLTDKPFATASSKIVQYRSDGSSERTWFQNADDTWQPSKQHFYSKPVALLIGPKTFSAAEDFTLAFDIMKRGPLVGEATGGSTGQPYLFSLPGGGSARVCAKRDTYPDGKEFVGIGIQPTVKVTPTITDLLAGNDATLEQAIATLTRP